MINTLPPPRKKKKARSSHFDYIQATRAAAAVAAAAYNKYGVKRNLVKLLLLINSQQVVHCPGMGLAEISLNIYLLRARASQLICVH